MNSDFFYTLSDIISLQLSNFHCICGYVLFSLSIFSNFWVRDILHCHIRLLVRVFVFSPLNQVLGSFINAVSLV